MRASRPYLLNATGVKSANGRGYGRGLLDRFGRDLRTDSVTLEVLLCGGHRYKLKSPPTPACHPFRHAKIGFKFEQTSYCLPRLCFASQMSQRRRKAAIGQRENLALAESFLGRGDRLIETTKTDECNAHSCKRCEIATGQMGLIEWRAQSSGSPLRAAPLLGKSNLAAPMRWMHWGLRRPHGPPSPLQYRNRQRRRRLRGQVCSMPKWSFPSILSANRRSRNPSAISDFGSAAHP